MTIYEEWIERYLEGQENKTPNWSSEEVIRQWQYDTYLTGIKLRTY